MRKNLISAKAKSVTEPGSSHGDSDRLTEKAGSKKDNDKVAIKANVTSRVSKGN